MSKAPPDAALPLSAFELLHTTDVEQARLVVTGAFCPHELTVLDHASGFDTRLHAVGTADVSLCYLDYGGRVHIRPDEQQSFYLVLMPLDGGARLSHGREEARYNSAAAGIPPIDRPYHIDVAADSPHLVVRLARARLETHLGIPPERLAGRPIEFAMGMDLTSTGGRFWRESVKHFRDQIESNTGVLNQPLLLDTLEGYLLRGLLGAQRHNYSAGPDAPPSSANTKTIRRIEALIESHAADPRAIPMVLAELGISLRTLQNYVRHHMGTTPDAYLRRVRLDRVRDDLAVADPARTTVAMVASRWGFQPNGAFARRYYERFGELPKDTLRS